MRIEELKLDNEPSSYTVEANTVWSGVCTERGCGTIDMSVLVLEKDNEKIKGKVHQRFYLRNL
jgi:hypothetical protein